MAARSTTRTTADERHAAGAAMLDDAIARQHAEHADAPSAAPEYAARHTPAPHTHLLVDLPLAAIQTSPDNPRTDFDPEELRQLAKSLKEHGQIEPIVVRPLPGEVYELIAGERRVKAAHMAGLTHLAAIIRADLDDRGARALRLVENLHRVQLNPLEEAHGFAAMRETLGMTEAAIATLAGRTQSAIAKRLALLRLPANVQGFIARGTLTQSHANALANLAPFPAVQSRVADLAASQAWPVSALEKLDGNVWGALAGEGLVRRLGHGDAFKETACTTCPFSALRKGHGNYSYDTYCLNPPHYDELAAGEQRARAQERAAKVAAAEAAGGAGLPQLDTLRASLDYVDLGYSWETPPCACTEACPCRGAAMARDGTVRPLCTDPARYRALKERQAADEQAARAVALQRRRDQLAAYLETLTRVDGRAMIVLAARVLTKCGPDAARQAWKDYAPGVAWAKKDKLPARDALLVLSPVDLLRVALAAIIGNEIADRQQWPSSPLEATAWLLGPDPATDTRQPPAAVEGACTVCGAAMGLTPEDQADRAGAVCAECA